MAAADPQQPSPISIRLLAALGIAAAVSLIYYEAAFTYFFNDDFHWLAQTRRFAAGNLLRLDRYDHFYRPVIEVYFLVGLRLFGCDALPFHVASIVIHLLCTLVLFLLARALTSNDLFALLSALFFAVQPGYVEAVTWIGAITDLLPALWYLLALWMHLRFLQHGAVRDYAASLAAFVACLLTHESSATLLPMMMALEIAVMPEGGLGARVGTLARRLPRYLPFVVLLAGSLSIAYVVNSRSYLVREGHYALGWHAVQNALDYVVGLYVGKRVLLSYLMIAAATLALLVRGSWLTRFWVVWIYLTLFPVLFFTWGTASRYLYVPAAGFAMLLAHLLIAAFHAAERRWGRRRAVPIAVAVAAGVAIRFAVFANEGADGFAVRTQPYERLLAEIVRSGQARAGGDTVTVDAAFLEGVPELYRDAAAETALCRPDVRLIVR